MFRLPVAIHGSMQRLQIIEKMRNERSNACREHSGVRNVWTRGTRRAVATPSTMAPMRCSCPTHRSSERAEVMPDDLYSAAYAAFTGGSKWKVKTREATQRPRAAIQREAPFRSQTYLDTALYACSNAAWLRPGNRSASSLQALCGTPCAGRGKYFT